jgi:hypothetical protein
VGEADGAEAESLKLEVASAVILESDPSTVVPVAVGLHDQAPAAPDEVDEQGADGATRRRSAMVRAGVVVGIPRRRVI